MILLALALTTAQPFTCKVVSVHDGDGLTCADGTRVRLAGIDANELNGTCHNTCAPKSAAEARDNLARLAVGQTAHCDRTGTSFRRVTAWCWVRPGNSRHWVDLSCAQVRGGFATRWEKFDRDGRLLRCLSGKGE